MLNKFLLVLSCSHFYMLAGAQKITGKLRFEQGAQYEISLQAKTTIAQQAMGQTIDFNVEATGIHSYKITNTTDDNTTMNHQLNHVLFSFDGMGQKMHFDSRKEKDLNGPFGKPIRELLDKKYDIIIDSGGTTLAAIPEKIALSNPDSRMALITSMLRDVTELVQPPQKGKFSFFHMLPGKETGEGDAWVINYENESGTYEDAYSVASITDSVVLLNYAGSSSTVVKAEMMGNETTTKFNNKSTGRITVDRATGIIKEKIIDTNSTGTTEGPFGSIPVTSSTHTVITVRKVLDK
jgi:Family of unknown function (DUF6263)